MENIDIEYKSELSTKEKKKWLKTLVAFSNTKGGKLYAFYDDFGKFVGIENNKNADVELQRISQLIRSHTSPVVNYDIEYIYNGDKSRVAFVFDVKPCHKAITWLSLEKEGTPEVYIRDGTSSIHPSIEELQDMILRSNSYEFDKTVLGIKANINSFSYLMDAYKQANNNNYLTEKILKSFNLLTEDNKLTVAGFLFLDDSEYKNANVVCNTWPTINKGADNYIDSKRYNGSIISLINDAINYIKNVQF